MDGEGKTAEEVVKTSLMKNDIFRGLVTLYIPIGTKGKRLQLLGKKGGVSLTIHSFFE